MKVRLEPAPKSGSKASTKDHGRVFSIWRNDDDDVQFAASQTLKKFKEAGEGDDYYYSDRYEYGEWTMDYDDFHKMTGITLNEESSALVRIVKLGVAKIKRTVEVVWS